MRHTYYVEEQAREKGQLKSVRESSELGVVTTCGGFYCGGFACQSRASMQAAPSAR